ncbi:hypothetical protein [Patiriisocius hiemis]|uniref:Outer membrane protein beta-barrel domain-containing protein n=1 Tax=Patiriisocius hiemis TaxID=3075604 RepID=A0ABU2YHP7_9FLAO|nr:hypothetical protein [Constantimarinum sp. W242]MDT0556780.1 hypothetical protein [Constantimarinum sp. W242]
MTETIPRKESVKPLRIGARIGAPNILTVNAEYVTPLLDNRVAATLDYMPFSYTVDDVSIKYNNFEIGSNIYLNNKGKGLYAGISYFSFDGEGDYPDVEFNEDSFGDGKGIIKFNTLNLKIGAKLGRTFYFRIEAGYGFGSIPDNITIKSNDSNETTEEEIPEIPGISNSGLIVLNFGFGFSFL